MDEALDPETRKDSQQADLFAALRRRAEEYLVQGSRADRLGVKDADVVRLLHELEVHQIELELQNDELRETQANLEIASERLQHLYDFAPMGYLTLDDQGRVEQANLTLARMLEMDRRLLLHAGLGTFVHRDDQTEYYLFRRRLVASDEQTACEVRLGSRLKPHFWARLEGGPWPEDPDGPSRLIAVSDVTDRRLAEEALKELNQELEHRVRERTQQLGDANRQLRERTQQLDDSNRQLWGYKDELEQRVGDRTRDLEALLEISRNVVSTLDLEQVVGLILECLQRTVGFTACGLYELDGGILRALDYRGPLPRAEALGLEFPLALAAGIPDAIARRAPVIIEDVAGDSPEANAWRAAAIPAQRALLGTCRSWMAMPLFARGRPIGVLRMVHEQPAYFDAQRAGMAAAIANQTAAALENARLYRQAQTVAAVEERQRMARELHDSVAQVLFSIVLAAETLGTMPEGGSLAVSPIVERILALCKTGMTEMRAVIAALRPEALRVDGLIGMLEREIEGLRARGDIDLAAHLPCEPHVSLETKEVAYRITQEALRNVFRHAGARHAALRLAVEGDALLIEVTDDGSGFDPSVEYPGVGLRSMRERVAALHGTLQIESAPGRGARIRAELPVDPQHPQG
jgi:signal transduction histidine kinase/PAS domain-containing protein